MKEALSTFLTRLGRNIARIRKEKGITQMQLADDLDMDRANLRRIEAGRTSPTVTTLHRLSLKLNVKVEAFFRFDETDPTQD